ncbi:MAG: CPBP family intramembrane glutamic endopeptidase [Pacificibacter sp.]|uniref:CPBP family intramembrane glutamic endopeptidase n=1 Tax=Pacificibacter sp. TaxID=1917866 RepID=UPI003218FEE7
MIPLPFIALTFAISLAGFVCILAIPAARSPESGIGLPIWLLMVWGPSLAAIILCLRDGQLVDLLGRVVKVSTVPLVVWALVAAPLIFLILLGPFAPDTGSPLGMGLLASMVLFNLILGPLGEELGWRGYLQEHLNSRIGWLAASLLIGAIWFVWHLPLWAIDSPHAQIAIPLFAGHVMCYAVIIVAAYTLSGGSILPAILIHLTVKLASNLAIFWGFRDPNGWFGTSLWLYLALAIVSIGTVYVRTGQAGWQLPSF